MERDIKFRSYRGPSLLDEEASKEWREALDKCGRDSVIMVHFLGESGGKPWRSWEPLMKVTGGWRGLGPGRRLESQEIIELQELERIEFVRYEQEIIWLRPE